ncbi:MAG: ABC transporter ATP-binding protein [Promethearchaeota archaeon]|nr:MAG: ABC transporter ATP-binding protein [Candidatus Lokiarchaeota archaeon]
MALKDLDTNIIEFKNIQKKFKKVQALHDVTFTINKGEIFGYIGPNGAGKTTTLKILVGLIQDFQGEVRINGELLLDQKKISRLIGYLPQEVGFQQWRTVNHALRTFGLLSGVKREELSLKISEILEFVGLKDAQDRKIKHLSGGMKQKLKLAQALIHNPPILVLDEPMSGLDPTSRWQMRNIIRALAEKDITIIFSSHILGDVETIADRIGILHQGKIVKLGKPEELQEELTSGERVEIIGKKLGAKIKQIKQLDYVSDVLYSKDNPSHLTIIMNADFGISSALQKLLKFFVNQEIEIRNFNYMKPSLEEVYLKYVAGGNSQ